MLHIGYHMIACVEWSGVSKKFNSLLCHIFNRFHTCFSKILMGYTKILVKCQNIFGALVEYN